MNFKIKLSELLKLHDNFSSNASLVKSLGDSFLYYHNPLFKSIRDQFFKIGFAYTDVDFCHYAVLPYASLPLILKEKKVPYFDNVTVLKEIETLHPQLFTCEELIKVKSNYTLHESTHCLATNFLTNYSSSDLAEIPHLHPESKKVFKIIMAESFANSVESFANLFNQNSELRLFYELNSYINHNKKMNSALLQCNELIGLKNTFDLIYISYLYSNCLHPEPPQKIYTEILSLIFDDKILLKKALNSSAPRKVFNHAFQLSLDFRIQTTGFFCAYSGFKTPLDQLLKIDILEILKKSSIIQGFLHKKDILIEPEIK